MSWSLMRLVTWSVAFWAVIPNLDLPWIKLCKVISWIQVVLFLRPCHRVSWLVHQALSTLDSSCRKIQAPWETVAMLPAWRTSCPAKWKPVQLKASKNWQLTMGSSRQIRCHPQIRIEWHHAAIPFSQIVVYLSELVLWETSNKSTLNNLQVRPDRFKISNSMLIKNRLCQIATNSKHLHSKSDLVKDPVLEILHTNWDRCKLNN